MFSIWMLIQKVMTTIRYLNIITTKPQCINNAYIIRAQIGKYLSYPIFVIYNLLLT